MSLRRLPRNVLGRSDPPLPDGFGEGRIGEKRALRLARRIQLGDHPVVLGDENSLPLLGQVDELMDLRLQGLQSDGTHKAKVCPMPHAVKGSREVRLR